MKAEVNLKKGTINERDARDDGNDGWREQGLTKDLKCNWMASDISVLQSQIDCYSFYSPK